MAGVTHARLFAALVPPPEIILALDHRLSTFSVPGRPVPPENWHITLRFFGATDTVGLEKLTASIDATPNRRALDVRLGGLGAFPNETKATVLWLDVAAPGLAKLVSDLDEAAEHAGFSLEERPFRPHLTLARMRPPQDVRAGVGAFAPVALSWKAKSFHLMAAQGSRYLRLETFSLA